MIKRNNEIVATAEQNITITQANYDKLTNAEKNNALKTYFISDGDVSNQSLSPTSAIMAVQNGGTATLEMTDDSDEATVDDTSSGAMNETLSDSELLSLRVSEFIGYAPMLYQYTNTGDGTIMGAIADLYTRLGVEPANTDIDESEYEDLTIYDYVNLIGDPAVLEKYNMPNITAALADMYQRMLDAEAAAKQKEADAAAAEEAAKLAEEAAKKKEAAAEEARAKAVEAENNAAEAIKSAAEASIKQTEYVQAAQAAAEEAKNAAQKAADDAAVAAKEAAEKASADEEAKHIAAAKAAAARAETAASNAEASASSAASILESMKTVETPTEKTETPSESDNSEKVPTESTTEESTGDTENTTKETTSEEDSSTEK